MGCRNHVVVVAAERRNIEQSSRFACSRTYGERITSQAIERCSVCKGSGAREHLVVDSFGMTKSHLLSKAAREASEDEDGNADCTQTGMHIPSGVFRVAPLTGEIDDSTSLLPYHSLTFRLWLTNFQDDVV